MHPHSRPIALPFRFALVAHASIVLSLLPAAVATAQQKSDVPSAAAADARNQDVPPAQRSPYVRRVAYLDWFSIDELLSGLDLTEPTLVRLVRQDGGAELGVVIEPLRTDGELVYVCGPAWISWLGGPAPKFDPELLALPFARIQIDARGVPPTLTGGGPAAKFVGTSFGEPAGEQPAVCVPTEPVIPPLEDRDTRVWGQPSRISRIHRSALAGFEIASQIVASKPEIPLPTPEQVAEREASLAALQARAKRWLGRRVDAAPPYGSAAVAWIEWMDARQTLLRVRDDVEEADRVVQAISGYLRRSGLTQLDSLLAARVPRGIRGFQSLCWTPCWVTEAGEVRAASQRLAAAQEDFQAAVVEAIRRSRPCRAEFVEDAAKPLGWLVGQLPNGVRVDEALRATITARLERFCETPEEFLKEPLIREDHAATLALEVWTAAWQKALSTCPEHSAAMLRWREELLAMMLRVIEETDDLAKALPDPSVDPTSRRPQVMSGLAESIDSYMRMSGNYLFAFPGDDVTLRTVERQLRRNLAKRSGPYHLSPPKLPDDAHPDVVKSAWAFEVGKLVSELRSELSLALYESCTELDEHNKTYPQPFPMRYASFGSARLWRIGLR
jgi:hypothetical protein